MAVTAVKKKPKSETGEHGAEARKAYKEVYVVTTNSKSDSTETAIVGCLLRLSYTLFGTAFSGNPNAIAKAAKCKEVSVNDGGKVFEVTIEYDTDTEDADDQAENPLDRPVKFSASFAQRMVPMLKDRDGNAVVNSHGLPYNPPPMVRKPYPVLHATGNKSNFDFALANDFVNHVNDKTWYGVDAGKALVVNVTGEGPNTENNVDFFSVTCDVEFDADGHQPEVLDAHVIQNEAEAVQFKKPVGAIVLLDGAGALLAEGANPVFTTHNYYPEADFDALI